MTVNPLDDDKTITPEEAINLLDELERDPEGSHVEAEEILCDLLQSLGHKDVADAFQRTKKRCGFWYA